MLFRTTTALLIFGLTGIAGATANTQGQRGLTDLKHRIIRDHPNVLSLTAEQFEAKVAQSAHVLVFDVREPQEYAVSRIPGAVRVDPKISAKEFMRRYGAALRDKTVLLYCSVGVRSSRLAARIDADVRAAGARGAFNLMGGVFSWHNTGRTLAEASGETDRVHGYNRDWARYLDFDDLARFGRGPLW